MTPFLAELLGTMFLIVLGDGVVANVVLSKTKGNSSGWIVITFGWAIGVFTGVYVASHGSGAHINPAITLAMAAFNDFPWQDVPVYISGQFAGAMIGAVIVWLSYRQHFDQTKDPVLQLVTFCTAPALRNTVNNLISEIIGTFILVLGVLFLAKPANSLGTLDALPVALLVLGIGLSLGGTTGYAINPARDLGPRIIHAILPIKNKGKSDWSYSWIPIVGPIMGGMLAAFIFTQLIH
ncbi:MAG: MIP/aquaporin family protein [Bacteroidales bacterium]|nr:MIP/aquaporin family protein [Bacteroidales bacterium]